MDDELNYRDSHRVDEGNDFRDSDGGFCSRLVVHFHDLYE